MNFKDKKEVALRNLIENDVLVSNAAIDETNKRLIERTCQEVANFVLLKYLQQESKTFCSIVKIPVRTLVQGDELLTVLFSSTDLLHRFQHLTDVNGDIKTELLSCDFYPFQGVLKSKNFETVNKEILFSELVPQLYERLLYYAALEKGLLNYGISTTENNGIYRNNKLFFSAELYLKRKKSLLQERKHPVLKGIVSLKDKSILKINLNVVLEFLTLIAVFILIIITLTV